MKNVLKPIRVRERQTLTTPGWSQSKNDKENTSDHDLSLHVSGTRFQVLVALNSNELSHQFLLHLDHDNVPIS